MFLGVLGKFSHDAQMIWVTGTVPHVPQNIHFWGNWGTLFPKFLKSVWGTGTVPQVPQSINNLGKMGTVFPMFLKSVLGGFWG